MVRLRLDRLTMSRNEFIEELNQRGIGTSVHWRPLHLHPYYQERFSYQPGDLPVADEEWERFISLPVYPSMTDEEIERVARAVRSIAGKHAQSRSVA